METTAQTCARLLVAFEDLSAQEAMALREGDFAAVADIQARSAPLVEYLGDHGPATADQVFLARIRALLLRRKESADWLAAQIEQTREELRQTRASEQRAARIAPVYGSNVPPVTRLSAVG